MESRVKGLYNEMMKKFLKISCLLFLGFPFFAHGATTLKQPSVQGLVGYWTFNEGTSTRVVDQSGNRNSGTLVGSPAWVAGKNGGALQFAGNQPFGVGETNIQRVEIPDSTSLRPTTQWTVCGWAYKDVASQSDNATALFWKGNNSSISVEFYVTYIRVNAGGTWGVLNSSVIPVNTWTHICVVYDNSAAAGSLKFYINGVVDTTTTGVAEPVHDATSVYIGQRGDHLAHTFKGKIDEVRLYNRALSATEVKSLYTSGATIVKKTNTQPLIGYWNLNERFPSVRAVDSSGNGNTGFLRNSANTWEAGARGGSLVFDGNNDFLEVTNTNALEYTGGNFSIALWMKPASDESDGGYVISKPWSGCGDYNYTVTYGSGQVGFGLKGATDASMGGSISTPLGRWSHVVATVDSNKVMKVYVNGVLGNSTTHSITDWTPPGCGDTNTPLSIGTLFPYGEGWAGNTGFSFKGNLDDIRLYNKVLTATEVATLAKQNETTVGTGQASKNVTSGLQWSYGFSAKEVGTTSVSDLSGNGRTGWFFGGTKPGIGKIGQGLILNGVDGYVDTPSLSFLGDANGSFTITLWVKPRVTTGTIIHNRNEGSGWSTGLIGYVSNKINVIVYSNANLVSPNTSVAGEWKYVSFTRDGSTGVNKLYENGVEVNTSTNTYTASGGNNKFTIGRYFADCCTFGSWFDGTVDEARLYNRALTAAEIKQLYNMGK